MKVQLMVFAKINGAIINVHKNYAIYMSTVFLAFKTNFGNTNIY
jgi:hypothetical protein